MFSKRASQHQDKRVPIAVFASGAGTTLEAIIYKSLEISSSFRVGLVVSNNSHCGAMMFADMFFLPKIHISGLLYPHAQDYNNALLSALQQHEIMFIALAGYMKKVPQEIIRQFAQRMVNVHPALLPRFGGEGMYGVHVHTAVKHAGEEKTGTTVHYVADEYDTGAIIAQESISISAEMSVQDIAQSVQAIERRLYPETIEQLVRNLSPA